MLWSSIHITYSLYIYNMYKMYLFQDVWVTVVRSSNLMIHNVTSVPGASQGVCFCSYFRPWQRPNYTICRWGWAIWVAPIFAKASAQGRCWSRLLRAFLQLLGTWIFSWKLGEFWMTKKITCNLETVDSMTLQQWCFFEVLVIWCLLHFVAIQTHGAVSRQSYSERPGFAGGILCGEDQRAKNNIATSRSCRLFQGSLGNTSVHESSGFLVQVYVWRWFSCCISIDQCLFNWVNTWNQPLDWILLMWTCCSTEPLQDATGSCWASIPLQWSESQSSHYVKAALDAGITGPWLIIQFWEQTIFSHQLSLQS